MNVSYMFLSICRCLLLFIRGLTLVQAIVEKETKRARDNEKGGLTTKMKHFTHFSPLTSVHIIIYPTLAFIQNKMIAKL